MKLGKISDSILKRTVFKSIKKNTNGCVKPSAGKDVAYITSGESNPGVFVMGTSTIIGEDMGGIISAINCSANNVAAGGCRPDIFMLNITLPRDTEEEELRKYMEEADNTVRNINGAIGGGHTTLSAYVTKPVYSVTCASKEKLGEFKKYENTKTYDIVMCGYAGSEGASIISRTNKEYDSLFTEEYLRDVRDDIMKLSIVKEAAVAIQHGVTAMHDIHEGGIFAALWELGEQTGYGFEIDIRKVLIKQSTIEICERIDVNPYMLTSMGSLLIVTENGQLLVDTFAKDNIAASVIGHTINGHEKLIYNKGEKRFLDKPGMDEIYRIMKLKEESGLCVKKY